MVNADECVPIGQVRFTQEPSTNPSMAMPATQLKLWWLMIVVAAVAVVLAWLVPIGAIAVVGVVLVILVPIACAPPGKRLIIAGWAVAIHPAMIVVYLYATWLTAWCVLGHRPRIYLDDPKLLGVVVLVPYAMTVLSTLVWPIYPIVGAMVAAYSFRVGLRGVYLKLVGIPAIWLAAVAIWNWDPLGVYVWFID